MKEGEIVREMHTRFTAIINDLNYLGEDIRPSKQVRKILSILPKSRESKVDAITDARDLQTMTMDELIGNIKTYEIKKQQDKSKNKHKKEKKY